MEEEYTVYVQINEGTCVVAVSSSAFLTQTEGWVEVERGTGDRFHHAQGNYLPQPLYTDEGVPRYKLTDGAIVERTQEELEADLAGLVEPVTPLEQLRADVDFLAALQGVVL